MLKWTCVRDVLFVYVVLDFVALLWPFLSCFATPLVSHQPRLPASRPSIHRLLTIKSKTNKKHSLTYSYLDLFFFLFRLRWWMHSGARCTKVLRVRRPVAPFTASWPIPSLSRSPRRKLASRPLRSQETRFKPSREPPRPRPPLLCREMPPRQPLKLPPTPLSLSSSPLSHSDTTVCFFPLSHSVAQFPPHTSTLFYFSSGNMSWTAFVVC